MARKPNPEGKNDLLEKCFESVIREGTLDVSIHRLAKLSDTSARMLIYHFESKQKLDELLAVKLERKIRQDFANFLSLRNDQGRTFVLRFWRYITKDKMFMRLFMLSMTQPSTVLRSRSMLTAMEAQTSEWIDLIETHVRSRKFAEMLYLIGQGALVDFYVTGNSARGQRCLAQMIEMS
jgi:AcrR family transcriptional regulator